MTSRTSFAGVACPIARSLDVVGDSWALLIVRDVFLGLTRFDAIQEDLGISRKVLTQRLDALVEQGVLQRVAYQEHPVRHDYLPTEMGAELGPVLLAMMAWGDKWLLDQPPVTLRHTTCGHATAAIPVCADCGEPLSPDTVAIEPGPALDGATGPAADAARRRLSRPGGLAAPPGP